MTEAQTETPLVVTTSDPERVNAQVQEALNNPRETTLPNGLTHAQYAQLIRPIRHDRVLRDGKNNSHVSQQDVTAHLSRVFGFGNFDTQLLSLDLVFEEPRANTQTGVLTGRWDVCYRATMRLTVKTQDGTVLATYEDGSTGFAQNQVRGDAHDLAMKSAISLAKKRCCINLGDQFGLSLYNKGQEAALVIGSIISPPRDEPVGDMQENVPAQHSMGNDETNYEGAASLTTEGLMQSIREAQSEDVLRKLWIDAGGADLLTTDVDGKPISAWITERREALQAPTESATALAIARAKAAEEARAAENAVKAEEAKADPVEIAAEGLGAEVVDE